MADYWLQWLALLFCSVFRCPFKQLKNAINNIGKIDFAISDCNKAIRLNPDQADYYHERGNAFASMGKYKEALKDFGKCLSLRPKYGMAYFNLAQAYELIGEKEHSLKYYQDANKYDLPSRDTVKIKARLNGDWKSCKKDVRNNQQKAKGNWSEYAALNFLLHPSLYRCLM